MCSRSGADALLFGCNLTKAVRAFRQGPGSFVALHEQISKSAMPQTDDPQGRQLIDRMGVGQTRRGVAPFWQVRGHAGQKHSLNENHRQPLREDVESGTHAQAAHRQLIS